MINMKRFFIAALSCMFVALAASSCKKHVDPAEPQLPVTFYNTSGYWKLESWKGHGMKDVEVYIHLKDRKYTLRQNVGSMYLTEYTGEYNLIEEEGIGTIIRGIYDYTWEYWNSSYVITSLTATQMVWVDRDRSENSQVFVRISDFPEQ